MAEEFGRPGTCRSKVGCEAIDEPCTNRTVPFLAPPGARFSHRNSLAGPLVVQCSWPLMDDVPLASFMAYSYGLLRNTVHCAASMSTVTWSPTEKTCAGWVCTRSVGPESRLA